MKTSEIIGPNCTPSNFESSARSIISAVKYFSRNSGQPVQGRFSVNGVEFRIDQDTTFEELRKEYLERIIHKL